MPALVCPRCQRANPGEAAYCYFDGGSLLSRQDGAQRLAHDFIFPSGRRCQTIDEFANACQDEWNVARDFLMKDAFRQYFVSLGRHDLVRIAQEAVQTDTSPDVALTRFLDGLPVVRTNVPKLDYKPRRYALGKLPAGEVRELELTLLNQGKGSLQGTVTVQDGADWITFVETTSHQARVQAPREQRLKIRLDPRKLKSAQTYVAQLMVVTNGGVAEVPVRFDLVAKPFPKAPYQGVRTPRELAERMRDQPKQAGPMLESGDIEKWFALNNWSYPVQGPIAKGLAGVQQFFEAMGLSKPPKLQLSQKEVHFSTHYPDSVRFQIALQTQARKWVYGQVTSNESWLKVLTPKVIGPQHANILLEADPRQIPIFPPKEGAVVVQGNGGQKLNLRVHFNVKDAPRPPEKSLWEPVWVLAILFVLFRLAMFPVVDLRARSVAAREASERIGVEWDTLNGWLRLPWVSLLAGFEAGGLQEFLGTQSSRPPEEAMRMARDFRHHFLSALVRSVVLWTWWIPAWGFAWWVLRRAGGKDDKEAKGIGRRLTAVVAGAVLGVLASASLVCFFLAVETVPHALWAMTLGRNIMFHFVLLWLPVALLGWALVGAFVGFMLAILRPIREVLYPPLPRLLGRLLRLCRLDQAAAYLSLPV